MLWRDLKMTQHQLLTDDKERCLAAAYSNTELAQKQLGFGGVFVVCNEVPISLLDKSIGNQAIKSQPFICIQILARFTPHPATISQRMANSSFVTVTTSVI